MHDFGAPPQEVMANLAPGMELGADGLPSLDPNVFAAAAAASAGGGSPNGEQCAVM